MKEVEKDFEQNCLTSQTRGLNFELKLLNETCHGNDISGVDFEEIENFECKIGVEERVKIDIPCHTELEVLRHFIRLSQKNYSIDTGFYPLGSCTMKYNPRMNEKTARFDGFANIHPMQDESTIQGALELMYNLQTWLAKLSGLHTVDLSPAAGAHGEYAGIKIIKKAHIEKEGHPREIVIIPDSAHGTNPATAAASGYKIVTIKTNNKGYCDVSSVQEVIKKYGKKIAAIMLTNPNTCGKFEKNVVEISKLIHSIGAYFYCDGANFNAIVGNIRPGDFGVDVMHFNLHKTFSTPHGGGGPGCGPIAVSEELSPYISVPYVKKENEKFTIIYEDKNSIGQIKGFYGQFSLMVRAYTYILSLGKDGLAQVSKDAVLSANYILKMLEEEYHVPFEGSCMHECLLTDKYQKQYNFSTLDIAKILIEYGFHPMTMYFPLIVQGAMLIEPTETETKATLDRFIETMNFIAQEIKNGNNTEELKSFPISTPVERLDETLAARNPILTWFDK